MLKQLILITVIVSLTGIFAFAQEHQSIDKKEKMEQTKDSKDCCGTDKTHSDVMMKKTNDVSQLKTWNKVCPVTGEEIDADDVKTVEYAGKTIGLCCSKCIKKFEKDPAKYMKNLNEDGSKFIGS